MGTWGVAFSICYLLGFSLEFSRGLLKLPTPRWGIPLLIAIGLVFHTSLLSDLFPLVWQQRRGVYANWGHWCLVIAWFLVTSDLVVRWLRPQHALSIILLPVSLTFIGVAWYLPKDQIFATNRSWQVLGVAHGLLLLSASVFISLGFVSGSMYLWQARRLKRKIEGSRWPQLPSLEWLWCWTERCLLASVTFLISGLGSGFALNLLSHRAQNPSIPWSDPIVVSSLFLLAWILTVAIFHATYPPARLGNKVAYLTIASFVFFAVLLGVVFFVPTSHARTRQPRESAIMAIPGGLYVDESSERRERCPFV